MFRHKLLNGLPHLAMRAVAIFAEPERPRLGPGGFVRRVLRLAEVNIPKAACERPINIIDKERQAGVSPTMRLNSSTTFWDNVTGDTSN